MDDVQEVQVSREAWMPGATAAVERTGTYSQRVPESTTTNRDRTPNWNGNNLNEKAGHGPGFFDSNT